MTGRIVVMGVSGSGKTTLATLLAARLGWRFVEGDALHPPAYVAKMAAGIALTDEDRLPFLERVADTLRDDAHGGVVASCSALKRSYRDLIRARAGAVRFVLPMVDRDRLDARMQARSGHFMPPALLASQLATLELPDRDEDAILVDGALDVDAQVAFVLAALARVVDPGGGALSAG